MKWFVSNQLANFIVQFYFYCMYQEEIKPFKGYRHWIATELGERKVRNRVYSLNAFSKSVGISAPTLCQVMSGKRRLGRRSALKIIERCSLSPNLAKEFLNSLHEDSETILTKNKSNDRGIEFENLELDKFQCISHWYHFAILSLASLKGNKCNPDWISRRLSISSRQAEDALSRLIRLRLIKKHGQGFFQCSKPLWVATENNSSALRKYHLENLDKAKKALEEENAPMELYSSVTMVVDEKKLELARKKIKQFRDGMTSLMASENKGNRVFTFSIQLYPISRGSDK